LAPNICSLQPYVAGPRGRSILVPWLVARSGKCLAPNDKCSTGAEATKRMRASVCARAGILAAICAGIGRGADTRSPNGFLRPTFRHRPARRLIAYSAPQLRHSVNRRHQPHHLNQPLIRPISAMIAARSNIFSTPKKSQGKISVSGGPRSRTRFILPLSLPPRPGARSIASL
jgi:hypothetical protein